MLSPIEGNAGIGQRVMCHGSFARSIRYFQIRRHDPDQNGADLMALVLGQAFRNTRFKDPVSQNSQHHHEAAMLTIYEVLRSRATRPLWLLAETGTAFTHVPVIQSYRLADPLAADAPLNTLSRDFLAISPQSAVPVMVDGDLTLTESLAITLHLARQYGGTLGPQNASELAQAEQWALFAGIAIDPPGLDILYTHADGLADTAEGAAKIAAAVDRLSRPLARLETHFSTHDRLIGNRFTVADIMLAECLRYSQPHAPLHAAYPKTFAWLARCQARPAFVEMMKRRNAEPA
ncbi:glutathione S-transferase family protein [Pseudorhodobacter sp.]|uniref:glutathione S-transferase family protein n=1 Tax=Pseudorhodobacter sp. TaxID=1934400 RepID=UPI002AFEB548|nr:glutathione S-transferase family protein [Pseudorhodobacter sp.]